MRPGPGDPNTVEVRVWDLPTRVFHWALVLLVGISWITAEGPASLMVWHLRSGYAILTLVLFRLLWGLWGSRHARFTDFVRGPAAAWRYARSWPSRRHQPHLGHNPLGGWMVLVLLLLLALQASTGLFATDDIMTDGPLRQHVSRATAKLLTRIHHLNFNLLLAAVALHVAAVLAYLAVHREQLITPMFTGRKRAPAAADAPYAPLWRAVLLLALAAGAIYLVVR